MIKKEIKNNMVDVDVFNTSYEKILMYVSDIRYVADLNITIIYSKLDFISKFYDMYVAKTIINDIIYDMIIVVSKSIVSPYIVFMDRDSMIEHYHTIAFNQYSYDTAIFKKYD